MNFVMAAKFDRKEISSREKNTHPDLAELLVKKYQSDRSNRSEEKGETFFLVAQNLVLKEKQNSIKFKIFSR